MKFAIKPASTVGFTGQHYGDLDSALAEANKVAASWSNVGSDIQIWQLVGTVKTMPSPPQYTPEAP